MRAVRTNTRLDKGTTQLIGSDRFVQSIEMLADRIINSRSTILITGETGTGKSLLAEYLFEQSNVYKKKLKIIPLAEISESLFESQLFGHKKGAFTGANGDFPGKIKAADGGTVVLEDIACLPLHLQAKILRLIEKKQFEPVGSTETDKVDIRVIVTANADLEKQVREGTFRKDLFFRLCIIEVELEPLRKRPEDIKILVYHFLNQITRDQKKGFEDVSEAALQRLKQYPWPGNVRQLKSEMERAISMADSRKKVIDLSDFSPRIRVDQTDWPFPEESLSQEMKTVERRKIIESLIRNNGNKAQTARDLKVSRRTLYNKMKDYGITI